MTVPTAFLILHGIANHRPPEHWQFWLAAGLAAEGHRVHYPALPDPDAPTLDGWQRALREQLAAVGKGERVLVCHSLACLLVLHAAPTWSEDERIDRLLLAAPPASRCVPEAGASFRLDRFNPAALRAAVRGEIRIACSDADPYNPDGAQNQYATPLGLTADTFTGAGHITPADGFGPWPWAADWCRVR